jgi:protein gp37
MGQGTKIEWCDHTFNAWEGCQKVSPGCANCYAETRANRFGTAKWGPNGTRRVAAESYWKQPLKWDKAAAEAGERHRVFCASLADVFEDWKGPENDGAMTCHKTGESLSINQRGHVWPMGWPSMSDGDDWGARPYTMNDVRNRLFRLPDATPNLDWFLLTKQPQNIARMMPKYFVEIPEPCRNPDHFERPQKETCRACRSSTPPIYRPNVFLGTSVENQETADERIPYLCEVPAAVRFLSCEPLLGPVRLADWLEAKCEACGGHGGDRETPGVPCGECQGRCTQNAGIHWVIAGGESGPGARPMHPDWVRSIRDQCVSAGVPFFFKQWGSHDAGERPTDVDELAQLCRKSDVQWLNTAGGSTHTDWDTVAVRKVGKELAGRVLDGVTWDQFPTPRILEAAS